MIDTLPAAADRSAEAWVRMRIRFAKGGDLRFASHRDLQRAVERLFRRAAIDVRQSEGFHPKPRFMFPSALALGISGLDEVFEVDLLEACDPANLVARLAAGAPPGLSILAAEIVPPGSKKAQASRLTYELSLPAERVAAVSEAVDRVNAAESLLSQRAGRETAVDLRSTLEALSVHEGVLRMTLRAIRTAQARPRDILEVLQLSDLEHSADLVRTHVELET
ncbi:MAG TPA: TIGR03936 family radical SAM-associated protein [Pirellulales bacterium]|nr:TIGR03936 family radical SAM-associated protein [Pirellulales bacterium]